MTDPVSPDYYNKYRVFINDVGVVPFDAFSTYNFAVGMIGKYLLRYPEKNGKEDLKKALWCLNRYISNRIQKQDSLNGSITYDKAILMQKEKLRDLNPLMKSFIKFAETPTYYPSLFEKTYEELRQNIEEAIKDWDRKANLDEVYEVLNAFTAFCNDLFNPDQEKPYAELDTLIVQLLNADLNKFKSDTVKLHCLLNLDKTESKEYEKVLSEILTFMLNIYKNSLLNLYTITFSSQLEDLPGKTTAILVAVSLVKPTLDDLELRVLDKGTLLFKEALDQVSEDILKRSSVISAMKKHEKFLSQNFLSKLVKALNM